MRTAALSFASLLSCGVGSLAPTPRTPKRFLSSSRSKDDGSCDCVQGGEYTCTCVQFCDCPNWDCDASQQGNTGCYHFSSRAYYLKTDGSGNTGCDSSWIFEGDGSLIRYNWVYFWIPGQTANPDVEVSLYGSTYGGADSQVGAYCTGSPAGGYRYSSTNGDGNGWNLGDYFYIRSLRADLLLGTMMFESRSPPASLTKMAVEEAVSLAASPGLSASAQIPVVNMTSQVLAASGSGGGDMFALKIMLWPLQDMKPYDEISCQQGDAASEAAPLNYDVPDDFAMSECTSCDGCDCSNLIPRCVSAIDRTYCFSLTDVWGAGVWDDLKEYSYDYGDGAHINWNYPMLSAIADRYTDTFHQGSGPGSGHFCNANAGRNPDPGTCVLTRFYGVACGDASWPYPSSGASADGASIYVLGCGTTYGGELRCGGPGQGWATYLNAGSTYWVQCLMTRVVDDNDADCKYRLER